MSELGGDELQARVAFHIDGEKFISDWMPYQRAERLRDLLNGSIIKVDSLPSGQSIDRPFAEDARIEATRGQGVTND